MIDEKGLARLAYAEQVGRQSLQMLVIAAGTRDKTVRDELHAFAERMAAHAAWLAARWHRDGTGTTARCGAEALAAGA